VLWTNILLDRYINFNHVYASYYALDSDTQHTQSIGDINITINDASTGLKTSKSICNHGEWAIAFAATKAAVLFAYPHHTREFVMRSLLSVSSLPSLTSLNTSVSY